MEQTTNEAVVQKKGGARLQKKEAKRGSGKKPLIVVALLLAIFAAAYLGLCVWAGSVDTFYPNRHINGIDVGGLTVSEAQAKLETDLLAQTITLTEEETGTQASITVADLGYTAGDFHGDTQFWMDEQKSHSFLGKGWDFLSHLTGRYPGGSHWPDMDAQTLSATVSSLSAQLSQEPVDSTYELTDDSVRITKAQDGRTVDEAALRAVRMGRKAVNQEDLLVSFETVIAGTEKKNTVLTEMEKRLVAYHEVGHALIAALEKHSQPVSKITIVPHTSGALGYTMQMPEEEKFLSTADELRTELRTLVGGRAAEQVVFGIQTTGASNDIQRATALARNMVTQYGMSEKFGLMSTASVQNQYLDGQAYMDCSQETAAEVDKEVMHLLDSAYTDAKRILTENRQLLDEISEFLLVKETITGDELMAYVNADKAALPEPEKEEE